MGPVVIGVIAAAVIAGLATIVGVILTLVKQNRLVARVVAAARVVSVLLTVPVFLLQGLPAWIFVVAAALVILNITAVILVLSRPGTPALPG